MPARGAHCRGRGGNVRAKEVRRIEGAKDRTTALRPCGGLAGVSKVKLLSQKGPSPRPLYLPTSNSRLVGGSREFGWRDGLPF